MFNIMQKKRDGLASIIKIKSDIARFTLPDFFTTNSNSPFPELLDGRIIEIVSDNNSDEIYRNQVSSNYQGLKFNVTPFMRISAHTPENLASKIIKKNFESDYPDKDKATLYFTIHKSLWRTQLEYVYQADYPMVWIENVSELRGLEKIEALILLKEIIPDTVVLASGYRAIEIPFLIYAGIHGFDICYFISELLNSDMFPFIMPKITDNNNISQPDISDLYEKADGFMYGIREAIEKKRLRNIVEIFATADIENMRLLRIWDRVAEPSYCSLSFTGSVDYIATESIDRPEIRVWANRLKTRYIPPPLPVLLLLPCSAKKPYSESKTHKGIRKAISIRQWLHEIIVTSPLGIVPRELETISPAINYDTVVTGEWRYEEISLSKHLLEDIIEKSEYRYIISYLSGGYIDIIEQLRESGYNIINFDSLEKLGKYLDTLETEFDKNLRLPRFSEYKAEAMLRFIYGVSVKNIYLYKNRLYIGDEIAFKINNDYHLIPMKKGASILAENHKYCVELANFKVMNNIFASGIIQADEDIHPDDTVILIKNNSVIGWGKAMMTGKEMVRARRGLAVRVGEIYG